MRTLQGQQSVMWRRIVMSNLNTSSSAASGHQMELQHDYIYTGLVNNNGFEERIPCICLLWRQLMHLPLQSTTFLLLYRQVKKKFASFVRTLEVWIRVRILVWCCFIWSVNLKFCFHLNFSQVPLVTHCFIFPGNKICVFKRLVNMVGQHWLSNIILFKHMNTAPRTRPEHILTNIWFLLIKFGVAESSSFYLNESD